MRSLTKAKEPVLFLWRQRNLPVKRCSDKATRLSASACHINLEPKMTALNIAITFAYLIAPIEVAYARGGPH